MDYRCCDRLFREFLDHPKLFWGVNNTGCEARADLMAEIAAAQGLDVRKIWVQPSDSQSHLPVYLNEAKTERAWWAYHVAPLIRTPGSPAPIVLDPALFTMPVPLVDWKQRVSSLAGEYDYVLSFKESPREAFYGPSDMLIARGRQKALKKRREILENAANLEDPAVFSGFLTKKRGAFADDLQKTRHKKFEQLKTILRNDAFAAWFRSPVRAESLARRLDGHDRYFSIRTQEIKSRIDLSDPGAFITLQTIYWERIGSDFDVLTQKSEDLRFGPFSGERQAFRIKWDMLEDFRAKWFAPDSDVLWAEYGLRLEES